MAEERKEEKTAWRLSSQEQSSLRQGGRLTHSFIYCGITWSYVLVSKRYSNDNGTSFTVQAALRCDAFGDFFKGMKPNNNKKTMQEKRGPLVVQYVLLVTQNSGRVQRHKAETRGTTRGMLVKITCDHMHFGEGQTGRLSYLKLTSNSVVRCIDVELTVLNEHAIRSLSARMSSAAGQLREASAELNKHIQSSSKLIAQHQKSEAELREQNESLKEQLEIKRMEMKQEMRKLKKQVETHAKEKQSLQRQLASLSSRSYAADVDVITTVDAIEYPQPRDDGASALYAKHSEILSWWDPNSIKLEAWAACDGKAIVEKTPEPNDDGKEDSEIEAGAFGPKMYEKHLECLRIIDEQQSRLDVASTDQHLLELVNQQNALTDSVKSEEAMLCERTTSLSQQQQQYESIKGQRMALQKSIKSQVQQCNDIIETENGLFRDVHLSTARKSQTEAMLQSLNSSLETCGGLVAAYNSFIKHNIKRIAKINKNFERLWDEFESEWMEWSVDDVVVWFTHKAGDLREKVDWTVVTQQMQKLEFTGKSLQEFNRLTFKFIRLRDDKIVDILLSELKNLKERYSAKEEDTATAKKVTADIPKEMLCPITQKIMRDPVFAAFDGQSYEKEAIEEYVAKHNKSPITGGPARANMIFPNLALKTRIVAFIEANDVAEGNGNGQKEGDGETALV